MPPVIPKKTLLFLKENYNPLKILWCLITKKFKAEQENATTASYKACYCTALDGEVHTIAELLISLVIIDVASCVFDEESVEKLKLVYLSNNTVSMRID